MKSLFVLTLVLAVVALSARENPFKPPQKDSLSEAAMENINTIEKLQPITLTPPVDSVKIKKITIEYQGVEGARIKKVYDIEKGIDPLKAIKVTQ